MQRLIFARAIKKAFDKDIRDIISANDLSDTDIAQIIIESSTFKKLINNRQLTSSDIFDKLITAKLGNITKAILKRLSNEIFEKIKVYNFNDIKKSIVKYIKDNLNNNESKLYKEINLHIYMVYHDTSDEDNTDENNTDRVTFLTTIDEINDYLQDMKNVSIREELKNIIDNALYYFICYKETQVDIICEELNKKFIQFYPSGIVSASDLLQFLYKCVKDILTFYFKRFSGKNLPIIQKLIEDIERDSFTVKIKYSNKLDTDIRSLLDNKYISNIIIDNIQKIVDNKFYLKKIGVKEIKNTENINNKNNKNINLNNKQYNKIKNKSNDISQMTIKQIGQLPNLTQLEKYNDSIGDSQNISLFNYYQSMVVISSDGNIKYFTNDGEKTAYINELQNKNINYAVGVNPINTTKVIICINMKNNMNINEIINICKQNPNIIKVYNLDKQTNFAAKITRCAKLVWQRFK